MSSAEHLNVDLTLPRQMIPMITGLEGGDPWIQQPNDALLALVQASRARERAESWRNFLVGASAVTLFDKNHSRALQHGANVKPEKNGKVNSHAEEEILSSVHSTLSALAVVADIDTTDKERLQTPTTVPCGYRCTPLLASSKYVVPETILLSATPDFTVVQAYDIQTLQDAHNLNYPELLPSIHFETPNMQDDQEWLEKFSIPLINRMLSLRPPQV